MDGFRGPRKGRSELMVLSEKTLYSVGRRCVYIFNHRKAKKEIPDNMPLKHSESLGRRCVYIFNHRKAKKEIPDNMPLKHSE